MKQLFTLLAAVLLTGSTLAQVGNTSTGTDSATPASDGNYISAFGYKALENVTNSDYNTAVGAFALQATTSNWQDNDSSEKNTGIGYSALKDNRSGNSNVAVGFQAMKGNTQGDRNTSVGMKSMWIITTGDDNTAIGNHSLLNVGTGGDNTAVGSNSLNSTTSGAKNTSLGDSSGSTILSGSYNVTLGASADVGTSTALNQTVIGYGATGQANNSVVLGNGDVTAVYMGEDSGATVHAAGLNIGGTGASFTGDMTVGDLSAFSGSFTQRSAIDIVAHNDGDLLTAYASGSSGDRFNIELDTGNSLAKISSGGGYNLTFSSEGGTMSFESNAMGTATYAFDGNTTISNDLTVGGDVVISSDARLKANIVSLGSTLAKLLLIDGKSYTMKKDGKQKIGVLAQDIQKVFPELVSEDDNEMLAVNYQGLVPVLINALKEQDGKMKEQDAKMIEQEERLERLEAIISNMDK